MRHTRRASRIEGDSICKRSTFLSSHEDYLSNSHLGQAIHWVDSDTRGELLRAADRILVWNARHWWRPSLLTQARKVSFSDPSFFKETEAVTTASLSYALMSQAQRKTLRDTHLDRFQRLVERLAENETAYAFFTGPSLKEGLRNPLREDSVRLVCNSLVRDELALAIIRPDVIAFSDPAYHFGVSRYAAEFRRHVIKALNGFEDSVCVVPERYAPLMAKAIPAALEERLIGIPDSPKGPFNLPTLERFFVRETGNVLTHLMVPLASSLADEIYVLGADGREGGERGFWKHLPSAQFDGLLKTLADAHPSIARDTDIAAYYRLHCRLTEELLQVGERRWGKRYVSSTPSYIPALAVREGKIARPVD